MTPGQKLDHYEIRDLLGSGGMGEVYRAFDTTLEREVAIKVLPRALAQDPERLARFEREAKILAALNHPNIATVHGLLDSDGRRALVMELVPGETLTAILQRGPLRLEDTLKIARQIAEALEAAHEKAVVHRDVKPGNVMRTPTGLIKVLDFGLAAIVQPSPATPSDPHISPTLTIGGTIAGTILGTASYMSPEQAEGIPVDKRADIWSFGVVLWEMLTGKKLFDAGSVSRTLADVLRKEIDFSQLPAETPAPIRTILRRSLDRDVKNRLRDIGEARVAIGKYLANPNAGTEAQQVKARPNHKPLWAMTVIAAVAILAAAGLSFIHFREKPSERQVLQYTLPAPEKAKNVQRFALSPAGRMLVIRADGEAGTQLWLRPLDSLQAQPLPGTEGADYPFWSPDSRYIAFFAGGKLKRISATGGPAQVLCDVTGAGIRGGTWNSEGVILFSVAGPTLSRVSEAGGVAVPVIQTESGSFRHPVFLPDGRRFLFVAVEGKDNGIHVGSLDSKVTRRLVLDESEPQYFDGHLLFVRGSTLMAQPVDPKTMDMKGELFPIAERISSGRNPADKLYSTSGTGLLVYQSGAAGAGRRYVWFDRAGKELEAVGGVVRGVNSFGSFALSPDGKRVVTERPSGDGSNSDLWITDLQHSNTETRFTFDPSNNREPVWSQDGTKIAFASNRGGRLLDIFQRASNGAGQDELVWESKQAKFPLDWSRDGRFLIYRTQGSKGPTDLWALPLTGEKKPFPLVESEFNKSQAQLSPNGRWLAYTSSESGKPEVYVVPFAPNSPKPLAGKWQVSTAGGSAPRWTGDSTELFYLALDRKMMSVQIKATTAQTFDRGTPQPLFEARSEIAPTSFVLHNYSVTSNGKRFLIATAAGDRGELPPLTVVVNWLSSVKK